MSQRKLNMLKRLKEQGVKLTPLELLTLENQIDSQEAFEALSRTVALAKGEPGEKGEDADPKVVAKLLKTDPEFIEATKGKDGKSIKGDQGIPGAPGKDAEFNEDDLITKVALSVESQMAPEMMKYEQAMERMFADHRKSMLNLQMSPMQAIDIRNRLESLKGDERLDWTAIKNVPKNLFGTDKRFATYGRNGIAEVSYNGTLVSRHARHINFTGAGVSSVTELNGIVTVNITGGGGAGTVDLVNGVAPDINGDVVIDTDDIAEGSTNLWYTNERVDDRVAALIQNGTGLTWTYSDVGNTLTGNVSLTPFTTTDLTEGSNLYFTNERAQDAVGGILGNTASINFTYNDGANTITADVNDIYLFNNGDIGTGVYDFGGATSFELPNSGTFSPANAGELGFDTTVTDFDGGVFKYFSNAVFGVVAMPIAQFTSPTNGAVPTYNSTTDRFEMAVPSGGGSGITIGTTTITSGAANRILIQSASGATVQQDSNLTWDFTLDALTINTAVFSRPSSGTIYAGAYPASIVSPNNGTAFGMGAGASITSAANYLCLGYFAGNTATTQLAFVYVGAGAGLNAAGTRNFGAGVSALANNSGTDCYGLGSLSMVNATGEVGSIFIGTNTGVAASTGFYQTFVGDACGAATANSWGNTYVGARGGQTMGGSFGANRNTIAGYASDATAGIAGFIGLGAGVTGLTSNTIIIGGTVSAPTRMYVGLGETSTTPTSIIVSPTSASGSNVAGADWNAAAGQGTGTGVGGNYNIQTSSAGSTGAALNALVTRLRVDTNGNIRAFTLHDNATAQGSAANQDIRSGTYTPTLTGVANVSASTARKCQWSRTGNVVTVSGQLDIDPTTTLTLTQLGISLPVASNFATAFALGGTGVSKVGNVCTIEADATNDRAQLEIYSPIDVTNQTVTFQFTYEVI